MNQIRIEGFHRLNGEVRIQGSKNAALPMMAAAVLCKGEVILHHCPDYRCSSDERNYKGAWWEGFL